MPAILIQNGRLFDGTQNPSKIANLLIADGLVQAISTDDIEVTSDTKIIDATGQWVMPGFVDNHTHYDGEVLVEPGLGESVRHGVTTVMLGGCSLSFVCAEVEDCCDMFTRVEAFPREILFPILKDQKKWSTPEEWIEHIDGLPIGPNLASFIGHSDIRAAVMGIDRSLDQKERPTAAEVKAIDQGLDQG